jgi:hypothetical protein
LTLASSDDHKITYLLKLLANKTMEFEKLKIEIDTQSERLNTRYMQELNFEKEKGLQIQYTMQQKYEKERKELEANFSSTHKMLEARVNEIEAINKVKTSFNDLTYH